MKRLVLIAALTAGPAFAQNVEVFVVEENGSGVVQRDSNVTLQEAEILMGGERPPGSTGVVLEPGKSPAWTNLAPAQVNQRYGGEGEPYIEHRDDEDPDSEMEFDPEEEERNRDPESDIEFEPEEDLFPEPDTASSPRIQPNDGLWAIEIRNQTFTGCPAAVEGAASAQMAAMQTSSNSGIFGPDFTPQKMAPQLDWTQVGTNSWLGILDQTGDQGGVYLQWAVQVVSPTLINHRQQLNFMVAGLGNCQAYTFTTAFWVQ